MIHGTTEPVQPNSWQVALRTSIRSTKELLEFVGIGADEAPLADASPDFPLRVPRSFARLIVPGDPNDPILRQVLPSTNEQIVTPNYVNDPLGEANAIPLPGVVHKYHGRVLLILTSACAINCRYCFRRHFPYSDNRLDSLQVKQAIAYVSDNSEIKEVILSGGDPLLIRDDQLQVLFDQLEAIPHLQRVRLHSRTPVVIPERLTPQLVSMLRKTRLKSVLVVHCNHPNEITRALTERLAPLVNSGMPILNQSVLLAQVNDTVDTLTQLSERLFSAGIMPYYLHLLDKVQGAAHFEVGIHRARRLMGEVAARLPGYLVPKLAVELPGKSAKTTLTPIL